MVQTKLKSGERFTMQFRNEEVQQYPLDVEFKQTTKFFDLETIASSKDYAK